TGFWTRVSPHSFKRFASGKRSTTRSRRNYTRSSKKPRNDTRASEAARHRTMPSLLDIRRRIRSVKNTQQLTKAMKTVSAAKLRRAQERVLSARPYAEQLKHVLANLTSRVEDVSHPLLEVRPEERILFVVVTADRGLCGAFNSNINRTGQNF